MKYKTIESLIDSIQRTNYEIDLIDKTLIESINKDLNKQLNKKLDFLCHEIEKQKKFLNSYIEYLTNKSL